MCDAADIPKQIDHIPSRSSPVSARIPCIRLAYGYFVVTCICSTQQDVDIVSPSFVHENKESNYVFLAKINHPRA